MSLTEAVLALIVALIGSKQAWDAIEKRRESKATGEARLATETWAMFEREQAKCLRLMSDCEALSDELIRMKSLATSEADACHRCQRELAEMQGQVRGSLARIAELEEALREQRVTYALDLADAIERRLSPPPSSVTGEVLVPELPPDTDPPEADEEAVTWRLDDPKET